MVTLCLKERTDKKKYCGHDDDDDSRELNFLETEEKNVNPLHHGKCSLLCSADHF